MRQKARRYARWHEVYRQESDKATAQRTTAPKRPAPASKSIPVHPVHPTESKLIQPAPTNRPLETLITPTVPPVVLPGCGVHCH
jgi:hypothetical protein